MRGGDRRRYEGPGSMNAIWALFRPQRGHAPAPASSAIAPEVPEPATQLLGALGYDAAKGGTLHALQFDVTAVPSALLPDLFVLALEEAAPVPVMAGARVGDPLARLAALEAPADPLGACRTGAGPVPLGGPAGPAAEPRGLLLPLVQEGRISHVLGWLSAAAGAPAPAEPTDGFATANLPIWHDARHAEALAYWADKRGDRALPLRSDLDPVEIPQLLRHLILIDVLDGPRDYRYRLMGDEILTRVTPGLKGRRFREIDGKGPGTGLWESMTRVVNTGLPRYGRAGYAGPHRYTAGVNDLLLPFSEDGSTVSQVLVVALFRDREPEELLAD